MDFFDDDESSAPRARPAVKFQPKAKAKARAPPSKKPSSAAITSAPRQAADNQHVAPPIKAAVSNDISDSAITSSAGARVPNNVVNSEQTTNLQASSSVNPFVSSMENLSTITGHMEENATSKDRGIQCENTAESMVENAEAFIRLDSVDDFVPQSTSAADGLTSIPAPVRKEQLSSKDTVASSNAGDIQMKGGQLELEGGHAFTSSESFDLMSEVGASSGKKASKFKPKIKKTGKKKVSVEPASDPKDTLGVPSETRDINQGSVDGGPDFPDVRVDDALSRETECILNQEGPRKTSPDFTPDPPLITMLGKRASKFQSKIKKKQLKKKVSFESASDPKDTSVAPSETQNTNQGSVDGGPDFLDMRVEDALSREAECILNQEGPFETSPDCPLNQAAQLPQSPSGFAAEASDQVNLNEAENNNDHNEEEEQPNKRNPSSRSDKDAIGTRKSARKRKKTTKASEKPNEETTEAVEKPNEQPPKKFSRCTRRRHRCVDQSLLETPEDEIDYQSLPIKDLIMLAEHRERQLALEKKAETTQPVMPPEETIAAEEPAQKTNDNVWGDDSVFDDYDDDDMYNPGQAAGSFDGPSTSAVVRDTSYFNYHSHMNKTPRVKWTRQDTVLFYEGVRQFGSDLSMIQNLFPGRTRQQIKLKYKKEERQKPMELLDALTNRAKDFSHYKLVIGRLQEQIDREEAAEEASRGATGNEGNPEEGADDDIQEQAQDEAAKSEQNGDGLGAVEDPDAAKVGSPTESTESELDTGDDWGEYKSDF